MPNILCIETATQVCSVALITDKKIIALKESKEANSHSKFVTLMIDEMLRENNLEFSDLDAIAISKGPGSYTGLRIGVSTAKGFCYALDIPLISVGTLHSMALGASKIISDINNDNNVLLCPMIDARRMEVYSALYDINGNEVRKVMAEIIDENSFDEILKTKKMFFFGDGAEKCKIVLGQKNNVEFLDDFFPSSQYMLEVVNFKFNKSDFEDVAYFEPFYLKDFIAGKPRVKGLY